jgi:hypothetical protein
MCFAPKVPKESAASISARKREAERVRTETARLKGDDLEQRKRGGSASIVRSLLAGANPGSGFGSNVGGSGRNYFG